MKKLILISGHLQNGKNQFAEYLSQELKSKGLKVSQDLFALGVKKGCQEDFKNLSVVLQTIAHEIKSKIDLFVDRKTEMLNPDILKDIDKSLSKLIINDENWFEDKTLITRTILQLYGTEIFRKRVDDNWWVNEFKRRVILSDSDIIINTDCRFPNEIDGMYCDEYETNTVRIERSINTNSQIALHESETALDDWNEWDYKVENNGTLEDLKSSAKLVANNITEAVFEDYDGLFTRMDKVLTNIK